LLTKDAGGNPSLRLENAGAVDVEFYRDIRPILQAHCVSCHTQNDPTPPGDLVLDDLDFYNGTFDLGYGDYVDYPGDYARLARDNRAVWGYPPLVNVGGPVWRQTNASRYVRAYQSRRSLLMWKIFGERLDGWSNADHPTESVPGDAGTLPPGAAVNQADLDFTGTMMPPPGSGVPPLSEDQKMTMARWIDLGCPINLGDGGPNEDFGWFVDDVKPAVAVSSPRPGGNDPAPSVIRVGLADAYSGIDLGSLSITADFDVAGRSPGEELADLASASGGDIFTIPLGALEEDVFLHVTVVAADNQGNETRVRRRFFVGDPPPTPPPSPTPTCAPTPLACRSAGRSVLSMKAASQRLTWKWLRGEDTSTADFGNPLGGGGTRYLFCLYQDADLARSASVPPAGFCDGRPCWKALSTKGYRYGNRSGGLSGAKAIVLREGTGDRAKAIVRSQGGPALPALPVTAASLTVQLVRADDPAKCWGTTFTATLTNSSTTYRALAP
jgi:hypothetical protein